jgi:hypothetical protein
MPSSQWGKLRHYSLPLLGNNVAVFHVDGSHLHHSVGRVDCRFEVVNSTAGLDPDSNVNLAPNAAGSEYTLRHFRATANPGFGTAQRYHCNDASVGEEHRWGDRRDRRLGRDPCRVRNFVSHGNGGRDLSDCGGRRHDLHG